MNNSKLSQSLVKRLIFDIKDVFQNITSKEEIYYKHDENNFLNGYALIIGPKDTPYSFGYFLFKFIFPSDYPHSPPTVNYCTNDGVIRFHPNLYKNGKVCLSILNTWKGEQWTGSITLRTILLSIWSILQNNSLLNEPGVKENHKDIENYNKIISYGTINTGILTILKNENLDDKFHIFEEIIQEKFIQNYEKILEKLKELQDYDNKIIYIDIYRFQKQIKYEKLKNQLEKEYLNLQEKKKLKIDKE